MNRATSADPLDEIAQWVARVPSSWPREAYAAAENALVDTIACMIAGADQPAIHRLYGLVSQWGAGPATVIGARAKLSAPWGALVNGASAHALDYDDNFDPAKAHASAVLIPALLAVGEQEGLTLEALLDAYIVGLQAMGHVGQAVNPFHRNRGWHATATVGAIGAAAGCARLLRLDPAKTAHGVSMSTSRAGGFMSQFGTDTKPLHAGFAASGAVQSALMARAGMTAGAATLDGPHSLRSLMVGPDVEDRAHEMLGTDEHGQSTSFVAGRIAQPLQILAHGLKVKRFPNCGSTHRALDGLLELRETHDLTADNVVSIHVRAPASHLRNLPYDDPHTPNEAKFSLEYNLAVALEQGTVGLADFAPEAMARPHIRALFERITKEPVEQLESAFATEVHARTHARKGPGQTFSTSVAMPFGSREAPLTRDQLFAKLEDCCAAAKLGTRTRGISEALRTLDRSARISDLTALLAMAGAD
ncbi:MAG: MmgE/PrpD family protein [Pseudomonadota bacterium]